MDSGASRHMTSDESIFLNQRSINIIIKIANEGMLKIRWIGDVQINLIDHTIQMRDVLYVPGLNANLLSIHALTRKDFEVLFNKVGVRILRGSILIVIGIARRRTYFLRTVDTALYTTEEKKAPIFEKSVEIISSGAIDASENSEKIP